MKTQLNISAAELVLLHEGKFMTLNDEIEKESLKSMI